MYQIVLTENRKKVKVLYTYTREHDVVYRFERIKSENVIFPKRFVYRDKKLTEVVYEVLLLKRRGNDDKDRLVRNNYGKLVEESVDDKDWVIVDKLNYFIEEQFNVTGANRKLTAKEIVDHIIKSNIKESDSKQVVLINNKIVVEGSSLYMITCKTIDEAIRLYNYMRTYCHENKIGGIIFFGTVDKVGRKPWYKKIHELTGVSYNRLYRKSSR